MAIIIIHYYRPSDSRVLYALGFCYDTLEQTETAKKVITIWYIIFLYIVSALFQCYKRAIALQEPEGVAIVKLAK